MWQRQIPSSPSLRLLLVLTATYAFGLIPANAQVGHDSLHYSYSLQSLERRHDYLRGDQASLKYNLSEDLAGETLLKAFTAAKGPQDNKGNGSWSASTDLIGITDINQVKLSIDDTLINYNRSSVKLTSNKRYNGANLFVFNITHQPYGPGLWPAVWLSDTQNWPHHGEIDVLEGLWWEKNTVTIHSANGCKVRNNPSLFTGRFAKPMKDKKYGSCSREDGKNSKCSIITDSQAGYGSVFNAQGGGTYALEWSEDGFAVWFWECGQEPADLVKKDPRPSGWGKPVAFFSSRRCNNSQYFKNAQIIINTVLCGTWNNWDTVNAKHGQTESAADYTGFQTCEDYVSRNGTGVAKDAYWLFNSIEVYDRV